MNVWVEYQYDYDKTGEQCFDIPEMDDDDAIMLYLRNMILENEPSWIIKNWDRTEECGSCGHVATKTMWDKGKVDCCQHCSGCDSYKPYGEDWALEATWGADNEGDLCPECVQFYLKCDYCNARGVDTIEGDKHFHAECAANE